jgi:DNA repair exonuclease SbcCD ATPase subunit
VAAARRPDGGSPEGSDERLAEVARELYGLPPEEFTAARTAAAKEARASGDRGLATRLGALRRPAVAAWAVNLLVRERAALVEQVTAMGESLREAQAQLDGAALRDLTRQRRRLVAAVTAEVEAVAAEQDHPLSAAASRQVEETLQAALVDPRAAAAVRSGLLVQPLTSTGVESVAEVLGVPLPAEAAVTAPAAPAGPAAPAAEDGRPSLSLVSEDEEAARRAAQERAAAAAKAARKAAKARDKALAARAKAQARVLQLEATLEELRGRLAETEALAEEAARRLADREAAAEAAEEQAREAQARKADADAAAEAVSSRPS